MGVFFRPTWGWRRLGAGPTILLVLGGLLLLGGCSKWSQKSDLMRQLAATGDFHAAALVFEEQPAGEDVLIDLELGLLHAYEGRGTDAATRFEAASLRMEELYTKSISREALAFLSNDMALPYGGWPHELVHLHVQAALARYENGDREGALVELRRSENVLAKLGDQRAGEEGQWFADPFASWLAAWLFYDAGEIDNAMVSMRKASVAFESSYELFEMPIPSSFEADRLAMAALGGFEEESESWSGNVSLRSRAAAAEIEAALVGDEGILLVIFENGQIAYLVEERLDFPILKDEEIDADEAYAETVRRRGSRGHYHPAPNTEIAYWLSLAMPQLVAPPPRWTNAYLALDAGEAGNAVSVETPLEVASNLSATMSSVFEEKSGNRMVRTLIRAIAKALATREFKEKNKLAGFLANAAGAFSERADTRSWSLLPARMELARRHLPAGEHQIRLIAETPRGESHELFVGPVSIRPGRVSLIRVRRWE